MLSRPVLLYDGTCGFCRRWVNRLQRWDRQCRIAYIAYQDRTAVVGLPPITDEALERAMHLVLPDGSVHRGARALPGIFGCLPGGRPLEWLFRMPPVSWVARWVYAWVAANRHRLSGRGTACAVDETVRQSGASSPRPR